MIPINKGRELLIKRLSWLFPLGLLGWFGSGLIAMYLRYIRQPNLMYPEQRMNQFSPYLMRGGIRNDASNLERSLGMFIKGPLALGEELGIKISHGVNENVISVIQSFYDGIESTLGRLSAKKISEDEIGVLYRGEGWRLITEDYVYVRVQDDTGNHYLRVPPWVNSAREGIAWTFQMESIDYQPNMET